MSTSQRQRRNLAGLLLAAALVAPNLGLSASGQAMRDLIEAALDQKLTTKIEIGERPIREALAELERATGLQFAIDPAAIEWMPYGEQTRLAIVMQDVSVRAGLTRVFDGLGLALRTGDDKVLVEPAPCVDRLGRRLTLDEVGLLQKLAAQPWSALKGSDVAVQFRLASEGDHQRAFDEAMAGAAPGNAFSQLEAATQALGWLWTPSGSMIAIYSRSEDIQQRLDRPLDVSYQRMALDKLLVDLASRLDITVHFEPGALDRVSAAQRYVDLVQRGITMRQILELIVGNTGLWYEVVEDGLVIGTPPASSATGETPAAATDTGGASPVVAVLRVKVDDNTTVDLLIRANELPPEFAQLKAKKLPQVIEALRAQLKD